MKKFKTPSEKTLCCHRGERRKAFVPSLDPQSLQRPRRGSRARDADATAALRDAEPRAHLPPRPARAPQPRSPRSQSTRPPSARRRPLPGPHRGRPPPPGGAQEPRRLRGTLPAEPRRGRAGAAAGQGLWGAAKLPAGQPAGGCGGGGPGGCGGARAAGRPAETCPGPRAPGSVPSTSATTKPANVMVPVPPARVHLPFSSRPGCEGGRRGRGVPLIPPAAHPPPPPLGSPARGGRASGAAVAVCAATCRCLPERRSAPRVTRPEHPAGCSPARSLPSARPSAPGATAPPPSLFPRRPPPLLLPAVPPRFPPASFSPARGTPLQPPSSGAVPPQLGLPPTSLTLSQRAEGAPAQPDRAGAASQRSRRGWGQKGAGSP